jgi:hypothetical protein
MARLYVVLANSSQREIMWWNRVYLGEFFSFTQWVWHWPRRCITRLWNEQSAPRCINLFVLFELFTQHLSPVNPPHEGIIYNYMHMYSININRALCNQGDALYNALASSQARADETNFLARSRWVYKTLMSLLWKLPVSFDAIMAGEKSLAYRANCIKCEGFVRNWWDGVKKSAVGSVHKCFYEWK